MLIVSNGKILVKLSFKFKERPIMIDAFIRREIDERNLNEIENMIKVAAKPFPLSHEKIKEEEVNLQW